MIYCLFCAFLSFVYWKMDSFFWEPVEDEDYEVEHDVEQLFEEDHLMVEGEIHRRLEIANIQIWKDELNEDKEFFENADSVDSPFIRGLESSRESIHPNSPKLSNEEIMFGWGEAQAKEAEEITLAKQKSAVVSDRLVKARESVLPGLEHHSSFGLGLRNMFSFQTSIERPNQSSTPRKTENIDTGQTSENFDTSDQEDVDKEDSKSDNISLRTVPKTIPNPLLNKNISIIKLKDDSL
eukprot:UN32351